LFYPYGRETKMELIEINKNLFLKSIIK